MGVDRPLNQPAAAGLPADLLAAIAAPGGGRVVLILGAGCSHEQPTGLPLSGDLSQECHRRLVADRVLGADVVADPRDLSTVAQAVFNLTGGQGDLVERFPPDRFRNAEPNNGYLILAALLIEGAVSCGMTLNFDLAASTALGQLGAGDSVSTIGGPEEHHRLGARNLIYLHRNIASDPDRLILRRTALEEEWRGRWEEVVVRRIVGGPMTVFVGLGSPAGVLVETTQRILGNLRGVGATVYVVDPLEAERSAFFAALGLAPELYVQMGWTEFMQHLADRLIFEHRASIERECRSLINDLGLDQEDVPGICERLGALGFIKLGRLRATWVLESRSYLPFREVALRLLADILLVVGMVERLSGMRATFREEGLVEFSAMGRVAEVIVCSGGGWMRWAQLEASLAFRLQQLDRQGRKPSAAMVAGVVGGRAQIATPVNIAGETDTNDVALGAPGFTIVTVDELRERPGLVREVIG